MRERIPDKWVGVEASSLVLGVTVDICVERGMREEEVLREIPHTREFLLDKKNRVSHACYTRFYENVYGHFGEAGLTEICTESLQPLFFRVMGSVMRLSVSPRKMYSLLEHDDGPIMNAYRAMKSNTITETGPNSISIVTDFYEGYYVNDVLLIARKAFCAALPTVLGIPPSQISTHRLEEGRIRWDVTYAGYTPLLHKIWNAIRYPFTLRSAYTAVYEATTDAQAGRVELHRESTAREHAESELQDMEMNFALIAENMRDLIWAVDREFNFTFLSPSIHRLLGYDVDVFMGKPLEQMITTESWDMLRQYFDKDMSPDHNTLTLEAYHRHIDEPPILCEINLVAVFDDDGSLVRVQGSTRDIRKRKRVELQKQEAEAQLRQMQRLETVETLAAGIAHDFNNILQSIIGYNRMAIESLTDAPEKSKEHLGRLEHSAIRARDLIRKIKNLSHQEESELESLDFNEFLQESLILIEASLPLNVRLAVEIPDDALHISGDATQLNQLVLNLCANAYHAMTQSGGTLTLCAERVTTEESMLIQTVPPPPYALRFVVTDTGVGMTQEVQEHAFEAFYTTKPKEEGTGLGLSVVRGIAATHHGSVQLESTLGVGTVVTLYLPLHESIVPPQTFVDETQVQSLAAPILYVDDDEELAVLGRNMLQELGYEAIAYSNPLDVIEAVRRQPDGFSMIITDELMPELKGNQLITQLREHCPNFPALLVSGHSEGLGEKERQALGIHHFLRKPFTPEELQTHIMRALNTSPPEDDPETR